MIVCVRAASVVVKISIYQLMSFMTSCVVRYEEQMVGSMYQVGNSDASSSAK